MLKKIGVILNSVLAIVVIYFFIDNFEYVSKIEDWAVFLGLMLFSLLNVVLIATNKESDFISLFFRRKALEEKKKIQELENK